MANKLLEHNIQVTAVGRRQERLDTWVQENGTEKAHGKVFDISNLDAIPQFVVE
jgi:NADP-dependent 3-hydroxy acid dehydrogenase YdfG